MIKPESFFYLLQDEGVEFFTGVPDSLLKNMCAYITDNVDKQNNVIAANEGGAIALGAGYHLATGKIPFIYMQNSGIGNAINPILSLIDKEVYSIPMIIMIGWRGEPGIKDEPQHLTQGKVTCALLDAMKINYKVLPEDITEAKKTVRKSISYINEHSCPIVWLVRKNLFEPYKLKNYIYTNYELNREDAIKIIVDNLNKDDIVVATTGKTSRELFEYRRQLGQDHKNDFLTVGSMGHASQIALGIAMKKPKRNIYCFDGDGSVIMHAGSLGITGAASCTNFRHIVFNNGAHDSVGGQPTIGYDVDFKSIAKSFNYKSVYYADKILDLKRVISDFKLSEGPSFLEIKINKGARKDLGRPTSSPLENKSRFMKSLV